MEENRMLLNCISVIIGFINIALMSYCAYFWGRAWRKYDSPAAHALTISCVFIAMVAVLGSAGTLSEILQKETHIANISVVMSSLTFLYALVQFMFTRGYFTKENLDGRI